MNNAIKVLAVCVSAPLVAFGVGAPTAWAAPGGCSANCSVGGASGSTSGNAGGTASGGNVVQNYTPPGPLDYTINSTTSGSEAAPGGQTTGHSVFSVTQNGTNVITTTSGGNFTNSTTPHGHCTINGSTVPCG